MSTIAIVLAGGMSSGQRCAKAEHVVLLKSMVSKISVIKALDPPCPTCRGLGVAHSLGNCYIVWFKRLQQCTTCKHLRQQGCRVYSSTVEQVPKDLLTSTKWCNMGKLLLGSKTSFIRWPVRS
jgi:hypothetical protein